MSVITNFSELLQLNMSIKRDIVARDLEETEFSSFPFETRPRQRLKPSNIFEKPIRYTNTLQKHVSKPSEDQDLEIETISPMTCHFNYRFLPEK